MIDKSRQARPPSASRPAEYDFDKGLAGDNRNPHNPHYQPRELDPLAHPPGVKQPIEQERGRPKDTGRGGA